MAIRIQQYSAPPRHIQAGDVDPGFSQPLIRDAGRSAAADLTDAMLKAGMQLTETGIREYVSRETTRVSEALQEYKKQLSAERERYTKTNQGQNALGAGAHFDGFAREAAAPLADRFSGRFREMFMKDAAATGLHFTEQGQAYAGQQEKAWKKSAWDGDLAQTLNDVAANVDNVDYARTAVLNLKKRYMDLFPGMDYRGVEAELNQKFAGTTIDALLAREDLGKARAYLGEYKNFLGAAAPQYEARINAKGRELEARGKAARAEALFDQGEALANNYWSKVSAGEITPSQALLEMRDIKDPKLQRYARGSFSELVSINERVIKESEAAGRAKAGDALMELDGKFQDQFNLVQQAKRTALGPGATPEQKAYAKALDAGYKFNTQFEEGGVKSGSSPASWEALTAGIENGVYTSEAALKGSEYWATISPQGKRTLLSSLKNNQTVDLGEANRLYNEMYQQSNGSSYTASKGEGDKERFVQWAMEQARASNRAKEPGYMQKLVDTWFMKATIPGGKIWDTGGTFGELRGRGNGVVLPELDDPVVEKTFGMSGEDLRRSIEKMFRENPDTAKKWQDKYGNDMKLIIRGYVKEAIEKRVGKIGGEE